MYKTFVTNIAMYLLYSDNIKQAIMDDKNEKPLNLTEIMEEDITDIENVPDPSEYIQMA